MNDKFDELAKNMDQSITRRGALKKFGVGLAGMALACFGLGNKAQADPKTPRPLGSQCSKDDQCQAGLICCRKSNGSHICLYPSQCGFGP